MRLNWPSGPWKYALACLGLAWCTGLGRAAENEVDLRTIVEQQQQQIQELKKRLDAQPGAQAAQAPREGGNDAAAPADNGRVVIDDAQIKQIIADYLKENPGAGMPPGVQTGYSFGTGFVIRSPQNPEYVNWKDEGNIPFELRIRGRAQIPYILYKVTDNVNHIFPNTSFVYPNTTQNSTGVGRLATGNPTGLARANTTGDFSQLEVKRLRLIWEGTAFDPNFRYHFELDGTTRGLTDTATPFGPTVGEEFGGAGNGGTVDHAVRLFSVYVAYDWHPCCQWKGCGDDCPEGTSKYSPTLTGIMGKLKPFFSFEEVLGSANAQFVEFGMVNTFFDADDDNLLNWWGFQYRGMQDRLFATIGVTNGNESQFPNLSMDDYPGLNFGFWYDFGGTWNSQRKRYDLYGDSQADIDYSCKPVVRVGAMANLVWQDSQSLYGPVELSRMKTAWAAPGGSTQPGLLNGGGALGANGSTFGMDKCNQYTFEGFAAGKWRGFSISDDWFFRVYNDFQGTHGAGGFTNPILYSAVNPANLAQNVVGRLNVGSMVDYGMQLQVGYFIVPKKWEVCARWGFIHGESGNIYGNGTISTTGNQRFATPGNGAGTFVNTVTFNKAFREFSDTNEYTVGLNRYFRRQQLKWQSDVGYFQGGNPASGFQSPTGWIPGVDGWLLRTQITFMF